MMQTPSIETLVGAGFPDARGGMTRAFAKIPFIQAIDDDAFAIHDLFREFVASLDSNGVAAGDEVAQRMGSALVATGNPADGLRLLIAAGRCSEAVSDALARHAFDLLETGQRSIVNAAIAFLTDNGLSDSGVALAIRGALIYSDGSASNAANLFVRALERDVPPEMRSEFSRRLALGVRQPRNDEGSTRRLEAARGNDASISLQTIGSKCRRWRPSFLRRRVRDARS